MTIHRSCLLSSFSCRRSLPLILSNNSSSGLILLRAEARENTVVHLPLAPILVLARLDSRMKMEMGIQPWISVPVRFLTRWGSGRYWNTWVPALLSSISMVLWFRQLFPLSRMSSYPRWLNLETYRKVMVGDFDLQLLFNIQKYSTFPSRFFQVWLLE